MNQSILPQNIPVKDLSTTLSQNLSASPKLKLPTLPKGEYYLFHTMVKPTGSQCNLDCEYCFYLHKTELLGLPKSQLISDHILEAHIRQYIEAQSGDEVVFSWQGGEPTLAGLPFFKKVVALQKRYKKNNQRIENDLQTNGILLNEEWCAFLKENHFLVGLSIDGPEELHDTYRRTRSNKPTFSKVMEAVNLLHKYEIEFNALCVVNRVNAEEPMKVYQFLRDEVKPRIIQFLPCVEPIDFHEVAPQYWDLDQLPRVNTAEVTSVVTDWSVEPKQWGVFLSTIWGHWFHRDYGQVFVDQFENIISMLAGYGPQKCVSSPVCGKAVAIEHNGDLYSCDHYVYPEYKLGNIEAVHEGDLVFSERQKRFGYAKHETLPNYCQQCIYLKLCWGECPKTRFIKTPNNDPGLSYLCAGLRLFFATVNADRALILKRLLEN